MKIRFIIFMSFFCFTSFVFSDIGGNSCSVDEIETEKSKTDPRRILGIFGETFEIHEMDLLEKIQTRLLQMQKDGSLEVENEKIKERILGNIETPQAIAGVKTTEKERTFEYDPTIELTQDLTDRKGRIFARKGDRFNPLDTVNLSKPLLFIDGDDEKQIQWAISKSEFWKSKIILVKGTPLKLQERLKRDIYFDQHGFITNKLVITQVPAIVFQKSGEKVLTISEVLPVPGFTEVQHSDVLRENGE